MDSTSRSPVLPGARRARPGGQSGFSMVEVMLAAVLVAYAVASLDALFMAGSNKALLHEDGTTARLLANEIHVLARVLPRESVGVSGASHPDDVVSLESLDGARFSPPILADLSVAQDLDDWTQVVSVTVADLAQLAGSTARLSADGMAEQAGSLLRVEVAIFHHDAAQGEFAWWVRP